jgi:hypothetical protein
MGKEKKEKRAERKHNILLLKLFEWAVGMPIYPLRIN